MDRREIRTGVVGFGRMARAFHLPSLARIPGVRISAVADKRTDLSDVAGKLGIERFFDDYEEMFREVDLDLVLICTPPWVHRGPTECAAQRGVTVFCEKPMATNLEDCDAMIGACRDADVPLYIGFIRRFDPGFERLHKAVRSGELGKVFHVEAIYNYYVPDHQSPPYSTILGWIKKYFKYDVDENIGTWRVNSGDVMGGIFQDHCPHYADLMRWILGDEIESMNGITQKIVPNRMFEDQTAALFRFESGISAYLQIGLNNFPAREWREYGAFHGTKATMKFSVSSWWFILPALVRLFHRNRLRKFSAWNYPLNIWSPVFTGVFRNRWMGDRQMTALIAAMRGELPENKKAQLAGGMDGKRAMEAVLGVYRSSEEGITVRPEELYKPPE